MKFVEHHIKQKRAIEVVSEEVLIHSEQDALDLMATINYSHDSQTIILHKKNLGEDFFDLSTKLAGSILQKFINYNFHIIIIGEIKSESKSLNAFIAECNQGGQIKFTPSIETLLD